MIKNNNKILHQNQEFKSKKTLTNSMMIIQIKRFKKKKKQ